MTNLAPVVLFVYKRPNHTRQTVEYLQRNSLSRHSDLFIFSEFPKKDAFAKEVEQVREYIKTIDGFKSVTIIERPQFMGLSKSVISGISSVFEKYNRVIVLEDDILTAPFFLEYMNEGLDKYETDKRIFSVTGFIYPPNLMKIYKEYNKEVCLLPRASSWGWGTWKSRWEKVDWEVKDFNAFYSNRELQKQYDQTGGDKSRMLINQMSKKIDSWAIRWDYTHYKNNAFGVFPVKSIINNIGLDESGTHTQKLQSHSNLISTVKPTFPATIEPDEKIINAYRKATNKGGKLFKVKSIISRILGKKNFPKG